MNNTPIEWTDRSLNPIRARPLDGSKRVGHFCQKYSPGCAHCYASRLQKRFQMPEYRQIEAMNRAEAQRAKRRKDG